MEKEIYQLSTLLTDQRHLLEGLMEMTGLEKRSSCSASLTTSSGLSSQQTHQLQILMNRMDDIAVSNFKLLNQTLYRIELKV